LGETPFHFSALSLSYWANTEHMKNCIPFVWSFILICILGVGCHSPNTPSESEEAMNPTNESPEYALVIHGGAGVIKKENMTPELESQYTAFLDDALNKGEAILKGGGSSMDAVEAVIRLLEDAPLFNAGRGAVFTSEETNELDASFMDGASLNAGAVCGVTKIKHPISAARAVMEKSKHVMMCGDGANTFAEENGLELVDPSYFRTDRRLEQIRKVKARELEKQGTGLEEDPFIKETKFGTVGAVALDKAGNLAAVTSTGGMTNKKYGRVGDSPIIGAGTFADNNTCAVSCTGHGEYYIRNVIAYRVGALMEYKGLSVLDASKYLIHEVLLKQEGDGGLIAVDKSGNISMEFNTPGMFRGYVKATGEREIGIYGE